LPSLTVPHELADEQRQALRILADCFADDGILDDARNIRAALDCLQSVEFRVDEAEAEIASLRARLDDAERRARIAEAASMKDGWKGRAENAEARIERLSQERNEARAAAQAVLVSLKAQGQVADTAEASAAALRKRVADLETALREAEQVMRDCAGLLVGSGHDRDRSEESPTASPDSPEASSGDEPV
jgi:chromosome segregation ATPase